MGNGYEKAAEVCHTMAKASPFRGNVSMILRFLLIDP
jgi:hypothetical protein